MTLPSIQRHGITYEPLTRSRSRVRDGTAHIGATASKQGDRVSRVQSAVHVTLNVEVYLSDQISEPGLGVWAAGMDA